MSYVLFLFVMIILSTSLSVNIPGLVFDPSIHTRDFLASYYLYSIF